MSEIVEKKKVLSSFLKICQESKIDGDILGKVAADCKVDEAKICLIFEDGIVGIIGFFVEETLSDLEGMVSTDTGFDSRKVREKIHFCLFNFFKLQKENRLAARAVKEFYFDLGNLVNKKNGLAPVNLAVKSSFAIADRIWILLKDKSTDYNYYSKRLILSKIITKAFFVFINDKSDDLQKTADLIKMEIEKVMQFEKFKKNAMDICGASREEIANMMCDSGELRSVGEIFKKLPFIRLFN